MPKLQRVCPICLKPAIEKSHNLLPEFELRIISLECGHSYTEKILAKAPWEEMEAQFGNKDKPYKYQGEGYEFAKNSGFRALIADEPGLGKTLQTLMCLKLHADELCPALVVVKGALKLQYQKQIIRWLGPDFLPQIIGDSKDRPSAIFPVHITTYDVLWRMQKREIKNREEAEDKLRKQLGLQLFDQFTEEQEESLPKITSPFKDFGYKTIILDECQQIKNPLSKRAQQVREICKNVPHILASSGTPIKNHAGEYFTILNILRPEIFKDYKRYLMNYCDWYWNGRVYKVGGLRDIDRFRQDTGDFIIRRTKEEVLPDLPKLERKFIHCDFASDKIMKEYEEMAAEFSDFYYENEGEADFMQHILAKMAKLRHKAGINKIPFTAEFVLDFLMDTERSRKITIFCHHIDVAEMLKISIIKLMKEEGLTDLAEPLMFGSQNMNQRQQVLDDFINKEECRVLIGSTLAMGEGVDGLQKVCQDCIVLERQWNPANEEQVEGRFIRIGALLGSVTANYILSTGTIDEYFTELVEQKRATMSQVLDGNEYKFDEVGLMKELAGILARKGAKKWHL